MPGVGGTFSGVLKDSKRKGWGCGGDENKFYAAPSTSACDPENASMSSPNKSRSSSLDVLQVSDTFCFPIYLCFILISCSSVKAEQMLHGFSLVTQGSSPLPASLQVGHQLCISKGKQKCRHLDDLGLIELVWWKDIF